MYTHITKCPGVGKIIHSTLVLLTQAHCYEIQLPQRTPVSLPATHLLYHCMWVSIEGATTFEGFKTTVRNQNLLYEIIESKLNSGNAYCH